MNIQRCNELIEIAGRQLVQSPREWILFLEFVAAYFKSRNILHPVIIEVGTAYNAQKIFYQEFLNGDYVGIDLGYQPKRESPKRYYPEIVGDSHSLETLEKLKTWLAGRPIDLLFIDGNHEYESVKLDYALYGPLVKHIVAFHDIYSHDPGSPARCGVRPFWNELVEQEKVSPLVMFKWGGLAPQGRFQMGIGLVVKE